jgi:hypothetical protein
MLISNQDFKEPVDRTVGMLAIGIVMKVEHCEPLGVSCRCILPHLPVANGLPNAA